jgi:beta-galactosidase
MTLPRATVLTWLMLTATSLTGAEPQAGPAPEEGREATPAVVNPAIRSEFRTTLNLDGAWDFCTDPKRQGEPEKWYLPGKTLPGLRQIQVPGCWEAQGVGEPGLSNANNKLIYEPVNVKLRSAYTGAAWYKKEFTVPQDWAGRQIWLKLGGINSQGWVWINGRFVAHNWAYCGTWKHNVTDLVAPGSKATIAVLVRNDVAGRRGESNCLRMYGGLFRSVELDATPAVLIDNAYVEPLLDQKKARVHVTLRNAGDAAPSEPYALQVKVSAVAGNRPAGQAQQEVTAGPSATADLAIEVGLDPCEPWSPESPVLYKAEVVLSRAGKPVDGWVERFGMKKYEVRGGDLFLNNVRYFLRSCGDDHVYPLTVCSPASREGHAKHLRIARQYGFNYVRHHTHCEIPEFYEAADEVGIMVQPELPYYGTFSENRLYAHLSGAPLMAKDDLVELVAHYRRYTSLATYVGGNEGYCPSPLDKELYQMAKKLDASRPWVSMDGGRNTRENSDVNNCWGFGVDTHPAMKENVWPHVLHEYMSLGINEDPRLEAKYTGGYAPNKSLAEVRKSVTEQVGLDWKWAEACFDAGHRIQGIWHKIGIETARIDPYLDGFICWLMIDISPSSQNGVLNMFWEPKNSTPEYFREFNSPTVILARTTTTPPQALCLDPASLIYREGDVLEVDWLVSHFQPQPVVGGTLAWQVVADGKPLASGKIEGVNLAAGSAAVAGRSRITMPSLTKAVKASLVVELEAAGARNSWNVWIFPKFRPQPDGGKGMAAAAGVFNLLAKRYPGIAKLGSPEAASARLVVARGLIEAGVLEALEQGKSVVCLSLPGYNTLRPGVRLGWWQVTNQTGTAIAAHPAFGDFPNDGYLDQGWFRLVDRAEKLDPGHKLRTVDPLMVGIGRATGYSFGTLGYPLGFNLYVFQARAGEGKLLSTGLNLASDDPEAVHLLDQFIRYAGSEQFAPKGTLSLADLREQVKSVKDLNGWSETVKASETTEWYTFLRTAPMHVVRQLDKPGSVVWKTGRWKADAAGMVTFRWIANVGWQSQPAGGKFTFFLGDEKLFDFDITLKSTEWKSPDGKAVLRYTVKSLDKTEDSSGIMELTVPAAKLPPGGEPIQLRVDGSGPNSRRYFGLQESP